MTQFVKPGATLGIIGGGISSYLLGMTAHQMGLKTVILAASQTNIALSMADIPLVGAATSGADLVQLAELSTIVTYLDENVDGDQLQSLTNTNQLPSKTELLTITQDRYLERVMFEDANLNILPYAQVLTPGDIESAVEAVGFPCILKPMQKGLGVDQQIKLTQMSDIDSVRQLLQARPYIVEAWLDHPLQLTVYAAKNQDSVRVLPVVEMQKHHQHLQADIVPARVSADTAAEVARIATTLAGTVEYTGVFALELFVNQSGTLYVNRMIPMPNMHANILELATGISVYELHLRALLGWPLPEVGLQQAGIMIPLRQSDEAAVLTQIQIKPQWRFNFYPNGNHFVGDVKIMGELPNIEREINATGHFQIKERK